jgi:hypothetical protein
MMNRRAWTGTCAAVVSFATAGLLAQTAPQTTPQPAPQTAPQTTTQPPAQQSAPSSSANKITVIGCLKAAPSTATDTASAANANPAATTGTAGSTAPEPAGTTGTTAGSATPTTPGAAATDAKFILTAASLAPAAADAASGAAANAAGTAQTYRLIANPTALSEHVGKKLELTGTIDASSTADPKDPSAAAPALRVESGKIVAASCQ